MRQQKIRKLLFLIVLVSCVVQINSCDSESDNYIPYTSFMLDINLGIINNLKVPGYSMKFPEYGYSGVLVYCEYYDNLAPSKSFYHAFDATCTNEITKDCSLTVDQNNMIATCPCCGSKFSLFDGYPIEGEATRRLRSYQVYLFDETLRVTN